MRRDMQRPEALKVVAVGEEHDVERRAQHVVCGVAAGGEGGREGRRDEGRGCARRRLRGSDVAPS